MISKQKTTPYIGDISIGPLRLTSGQVLEHVTLSYERAGSKSAPVILVCHALTGNHMTAGTKENPGWWHGFIHEGGPINTASFQVITFNVLGGCDGSTGPASIDPKTGKMYQACFPDISIQDMVKAQYMALKQLNIHTLHAVIGGSLGGMQALEWGLCFPNMVERLVLLAVTPVFSDYGIAFNHIAETAIINDPKWNHGFYHDGTSLSGLEIARMIGMVTYRSADLFTEQFNREKTGDSFEVMSYLDYQGVKLRNRFDANSYLRLLRAMNHHDIGKDRGGLVKAAESLTMPVLALSYEKDLIYEPQEINRFTKILPNSTYHHIKTNFGHDGFLVEFEKWARYVTHFLNEN